LSNVTTSSRTQERVEDAIKNLDQVDVRLSRLINFPSLIAVFAHELTRSPFEEDDLKAYIETQRTVVSDLKIALSNHANFHPDKIRDLIRIIASVSKQKLMRGPPKSAKFRMLDEIIIAEASDYRIRTGKPPAIFLDSKTNLPGPFFSQVLNAVAARGLEFTYNQIHDRIKPLKAHPVHGALFR